MKISTDVFSYIYSSRWVLTEFNLTGYVIQVVSELSDTETGSVGTIKITIIVTSYMISTVRISQLNTHINLRKKRVKLICLSFIFTCHLSLRKYYCEIVYFFVLSWWCNRTHLYTSWNVIRNQMHSQFNIGETVSGRMKSERNTIFTNSLSFYCIAVHIVGNLHCISILN